MRTVIVCSALSETTRPVRVLGWPVVSAWTAATGSAGALRAALAFSRSLTRRRLRGAALRLRSAARSAWRSSGVRAGRCDAAACLAAARVSRLVSAGGGGLTSPAGRSSSDSTSAAAGVSSAAGASSAAGSSVVSSVVSSSSAMSQGVGVDAAVAGDGQGAGQPALGGAEPGRVLELAGRVLEAQAEGVAPLRADVVDELLVGEVAQLLGLHAASASSRLTNLVRTGSL